MHALAGTCGTFNATTQASCVVQLCAGQTVSVNLCASVGQDTVVAVRDNTTKVVLVRDDDGCGQTRGPSTVNYMYPSTATTATYVMLHAVCYHGAACSSRLDYSVTPDVTPPSISLLVTQLNSMIYGTLNTSFLAAVNADFARKHYPTVVGFNVVTAPYVESCATAFADVRPVLASGTVTNAMNDEFTNVMGTFVDSLSGSLSSSETTARRRKLQAFTRSAPPPSPPPPAPPSPPPPSPPPPSPPVGIGPGLDGALLSYSNVQCYTSLSNCNTYSPCSSLGLPCVASTDASVVVTCASGAANTLVNTSSTLYMCNALPLMYDAASAASGVLCYGNATTCLNDPTNLCNSTVPCVYDQTVCGSGYALASGNAWACEALSIGGPAFGVAPPDPNAQNTQGNEYLCYTSQAACEIDFLSGCSSSGTRCINDTYATGAPPYDSRAFCIGGFAVSTGSTWFCPNSLQYGAVVSTYPASVGEMCFNSTQACDISGSNACSSDHECTPNTVACSTPGYSIYCDLAPLTYIVTSPPPPAPSPPPIYGGGNSTTTNTSSSSSLPTSMRNLIIVSACFSIFTLVVVVANTIAGGSGSTAGRGKADKRKSGGTGGKRNAKERVKACSPYLTL